MNRFSKSTILATALFCGATMGVSAYAGDGEPTSMLPIRPDVETLWTADSLRLRFPLSESKGEGSSYAVFSSPRLATAEGDTLTFSPAVFRGKRNMHYVERERHFASDSSDRMARRLKSSPRSWLQKSSREVLLGDTVSYDIAIARKDAPWLWEKPATLSLKREKDGCCSTDDLAPATLASLMYVPPFIPQLMPVEDNTGKAGELEKLYPVLSPWKEYRPYTSDRVLSREKGALYVHFELDKVVLKHDFRGNAPILDRIVDITRQIMADSTSDVRLIQIVGLASVEGPLRHNQWLADNRAQALKRYIQQRVASPDSLYEVVGGGEAWAELRAQIEDIQFEGRDEMLRIIDTEKDVNVREARLKKLMGGRPYDYLRTHVLADQRNSGYLRIYYDYVPDTAAAVINHATELIGAGKYDEALSSLLTVKSDRRALNALGVAYYMTGNHEQGIECIRQAAKDGNPQAEENLRQWEAIEKAQKAAANGN